VSRKSARITGFIVITTMVGDRARDVKRALSALRRRPRERVTLIARVRSCKSGFRGACSTGTNRQQKRARCQFGSGGAACVPAGAVAPDPPAAALFARLAHHARAPRTHAASARRYTGFSAAQRSPAER
jgi:hypothetical protein